MRIWDYKGRRNMVLVFLPAESCPECSNFVSGAAASYDSYDEENAVVLAVLTGDLEEAVAFRDELKAPFPMLYDPQGWVTARYTDWPPAVFVADKFGELYAEWTVGHGGFFPTQEEILDTLELINLECPECGAPIEWA